VVHCEREGPTRGVMQWVVVLGPNHEVSLVSNEWVGGIRTFFFFNSLIGGIRTPTLTPTLIYRKIK
jgi:hypothetical protein